MLGDPVSSMEVLVGVQPPAGQPLPSLTPRGRVAFGDYVSPAVRGSRPSIGPCASRTLAPTVMRLIAYFPG